MSQDAELLAKVGSEVFDRLVCMSVLAYTQDPPWPEKPQVLAEIRFKGPIQGIVTLGIPKNSLMSILGHMLRMPDKSSLSEAMGLDALGEITNVVCGKLITYLSSSDSPVDLGIPRVQEPAAPLETADRPFKRTAVRLKLDEGWVELTLDWEQGSTLTQDGGAAAPEGN